MKQILIDNMVALFRANQCSLKLTCIGHDDELAMTIPVKTEANLIDEISPVLDGLELWSRISLTNDFGRDVFSFCSDDPRQAQ